MGTELLGELSMRDDAQLGISRWERWLYYGFGIALFIRGTLELGGGGSAALIGAGIATFGVGRVINHITKDQDKP
mgnify:CR=1 FL=1